MGGDLADTYRSRRLCIGLIRLLQYYTKVVLPYEHAMAVAYKQYAIITKIRVYRTLKLNMKHQKRK